MKSPASSELAAAAAFLAELREAGLLLTSHRPPASAVAPSRPVEGRGRAMQELPPAAARPAAPSGSHSPPPAARPQPVYRAERVRQLLADMCKRGGFSGAVLADRSGLAVAEFNAPLDLDSLAAFASVAGETLDQAERLLGKREANNLTLDINYVEKIVVRRFILAQQPAFLLLVCPQSIDERSEVELSVDLIVGVLSEDD